MLKNQKGITLVALVVTIVVLIILATISITVAINGGIMQRAEDTQKFQANADVQWNHIEQNVLYYTDTQINSAVTPNPAA